MITENKKLRVGKGIFVVGKKFALVLALALLGCALSGCDMQKTSDKLTEFNEKYLGISWEGDDESSTPNAQYVHDYVQTQMSVSGRDAKENSYSFRLPRINLSGLEASRINTTITKEFVEPLQKSMEDYQSGEECPDYSDINYQVYLNESVLSLVLTCTERVSGKTEYRVYNLNVETGESVQDDAFCQVMNWGPMRLEQEVKETAAQQAKIILREYYGEETTDEALEETYGYQRTMADTNLERVKLYMADDECLWAAMDIYAPGYGMQRQLVQVS